MYLCLRHFKRYFLHFLEFTLFVIVLFIIILICIILLLNIIAIIKEKNQYTSLILFITINEIFSLQAFVSKGNLGYS